MGHLPLISVLEWGPGWDSGLMTLRSLNRIRSAQVIILDEPWICREILQYAGKETEMIFLGKAVEQKDQIPLKISSLLIQKARIHGQIVLILAGNLMQSGKYFQPILEIRTEGIPVEIIPGFTHSGNLPGLYQIPLTIRGLAESFWVGTALDQEGRMSMEIRLAAKTTATLVLSQGLEVLDQIQHLFLQENKSRVPVAVISNDSKSGEKMVVGTLDQIQILVSQNNLSHASILVIGEVVRMAYPAWFDENNSTSLTSEPHLSFPPVPINR
ncbi:MAG: uroporphyrinogen-III C-methyltransferase [Chitinophagaceae bacterium]